MVTIFVAIVCCYAIACIAVHVFRHINKNKTSVIRHYVLVGDNHEKQMEWYIRSIRWFSLLSGAPAKITVIDEGATDETPAIVLKLQKTDEDLALKAGPSPLSMETGTEGGPVRDSSQYLWMLQAEGIVSASEHAVLIDLRSEDHLSKLPL
ncbi:hypothetical protein AB6A23_01965 [Paenibacillus tarimensis]